MEDIVSDIVNKTCIKCEKIKPVGEFSKGRNQCKVCRSAYDKAYRQANSDKLLAYQKVYREANKDKKKAYYEANREMSRTYSRKRRAIKKQSYVPRCDYWKQVELGLGETRRSLQEKTGEVYHIDHIYPLVKGGIDHPVNYQILTAKENLSKHVSVDENCKLQAKLKYISDLVLVEGVHIDEAIRLGEDYELYI